MKAYTKKWYLMHKSWRKTYKKVAKWIINNLDFDTVLELGCGIGYIMEDMLLKNKKVFGIDKSEILKGIIADEIQPYFTFADLTEELDLPTHDLAISTEVAEHLLPEFADIFVLNVCKHSKKWVCLTAAIPGQKGRNHFNLKPNSYWVKKVEKYDFEYRRDLTLKFRKIRVRKASWLIDNMMIFEKKQSIKRG